MSKIKVNELETATPTLNDTLLGSNATKEYACKVEDLKTLIGGGLVKILVINSTEDPDVSGLFVLDKTWSEIYNWIHDDNGFAIVVTKETALIRVGLITTVEDDHPDYTVNVADIIGANLESKTYSCESQDDYPSWQGLI